MLLREFIHREEEEGGGVGEEVREKRWRRK